MVISFRALSCVVALASSAASGGAATYHVAQLHPAASDANPGSAEKPWKTIARAAGGAEIGPGTTVVIHTGVYRERVVVTKSGTPQQPIRFVAAPAARVVVTGADVLTDWRKEEAQSNLYSTEWPHVFIGWNASRAHPDDDYHRVIGRAEQVLVQGYLLRQVLSRSALDRGTFFVDQEGKRLYVWSADNGQLPRLRVEACTRDVLWESRGNYVHVRGIRFRYAANRAQQGAALFSGRAGVVEDCVFEETNGIGATFTGEDIQVRRCVFQENGQMGFSAGGAHRLHFTGCTVRRNNTKGYARGWEAGANKLCLCRGVVLEKSVFAENRGNGIWFDIGNEDCTVRNCLIANNEDAGIFYEISYGLHAHDNVIVGNGFADTPGSWGAASGISLSSSPHCTIERNLFIGNREGLNFREQLRTTPRIGRKGSEEPVWNHHQVVRANAFIYNRDAQTWGWFDVNDERHWPRLAQEKRAEGATADQDIARGYTARDASGQPVGLCLEKLALTMERNLYAVESGQGLFHWGVTWKRHRKYTDLEAVARELGLERGSRVAPITFADPLAYDFRVPRTSPALRMGCYPRGAVPGVRLGALR